MIDLDALKRELNEKSWYIDGGMANRELCVNLETALAIIARHVQPVAPSPDRAALVERMAGVIRHSDVSPCYFYGECESLAEDALAAVEAAGWVGKR